MQEKIFEEQGFLVVGPLLDRAACDRLDAIVSQHHMDAAGTRNMLELPWCKTLAESMRAHPLIAPDLPDDAVAMQCTLFEKSASQNWLVPVHQDLSIAVRERIDHPDLTGWSEKEGIVFVQPPESVLRHMLAIRLHLDDCGPEDGPLRVVPGSHRHGRMTNEQALAERDRHGEIICPVERGAALLMKPLLLHASSKSRGESRRRVLHFVYGPRYLPCGLQWRMAV